MSSLFQSILSGAGRAGNEFTEARTANQDEKLKLQQFQARMQELQQSLALGKAPQVVHTYRASDGKLHSLVRDPISGKIADQVAEGAAPELSPEQQKITQAEQALGRPLKPEEKQILLGLTPKPSAAQDLETKWNEAQKIGKEQFPNDPDKAMEFAKSMMPGGTAINQLVFPSLQKTNRDDRYIAIQTKKQGGTPLTKDEQDYEAAYNLWVKNTKIDPGVQRAAAFGGNRYVPILDPSDPESVTFMRAADAARSGAKSPQSMSFQIDKVVTKYFTAGPGATTITYFNTAMDHLNLLKETADALQNGDVQVLNRAGNAYANATGNPAPNNFNTVRSAVAGELSKTFKGTGATDQEVALIEGTINNSQSPKQLAGAIDYYLRLMGGKMDALKGQYAAGKQGGPNFPGGAPKVLKYNAQTGRLE